MWGLLCKWWWAEKKSKLPWEVDGEQLTELVLSPFFQVSGHIELYSLRVERAKLSGLTAVTKHCLGCSRLGSITSWLTHQLMQNTWDSNLWPSKTSNNLWIMNVRVHGELFILSFSICKIFFQQIIRSGLVMNTKPLYFLFYNSARLYKIMDLKILWHYLQLVPYFSRYHTILEPY